MKPLLALFLLLLSSCTEKQDVSFNYSRRIIDSDLVNYSVGNKSLRLNLRLSSEWKMIQTNTVTPSELYFLRFSNGNENATFLFDLKKEEIRAEGSFSDKLSSLGKAQWALKEETKR